MDSIDLILTIDKILDLGIAPDLDSGDATMDEDSRCLQILSCSNFVLEQLYREYASYVRKTVVEAVKGLIDTSALKLCKVFALTNSSGAKVPFTYTSQGLAVQTDGRYNLTYAKLPQEIVQGEEEIIMPSPKITIRMFIYGVCAEYLYRICDYTRSASYEEKFKSALTVASMSRNNCVMPVRRWLL